MTKRIIALLILGAAVCSLTAGCVSDEDFRRETARANALQLEVSDLKKTVKAHDMRLEGDIKQVRTDMPEFRKEMDRMRSDLQRLVNTMEMVEQRGTLPGGETLTLRKQLDHVRARLDRMETRFGLPPLDFKIVEDKQAAGPTITLKPEDVDADETAYGDAKNLFNDKKYDDALKKFKTFLDEFAKSKHASSAQFYIGECLYYLNKYEESILEYQKVIKNYPNSGKESIALLKQAYAFLSINDKTSAKLLLQKVIREYPTSYAAKVAREKLPSIN